MLSIIAQTKLSTDKGDCETPISPNVRNGSISDSGSKVATYSNGLFVRGLEM